ncbi:hypothetical protein ACO1O0_005501 [Amphichorda felina]
MNGDTETIHTVDDGTDDYLHEELTGLLGRRHESSSHHADIQSLQEAAEIDGKVVLLMRGGCGFLEKVMWAQRRGAIAVIVGDNQKGGPLIQMFAHGEDVDNVTIPSVFTARTTAQLLSSLTQPGSFIEDTLDENGNPVLKVQQRTNQAKNQDWILVDDWSDEKDKAIREKMGKSNPGSKPDDDDFIIGVHDWRDPDMLEKPRSRGQNARESGSPEKTTGSNSGESNPYKALSKGFRGNQQGGPGNGYALLRKNSGSRDDKDAVTEHTSRRGENGAHDFTAPNFLDFGPHEGLWVTITPTSSASPFFDTLLVLVISPLVTLTVVYALLIIRARIRRRSTPWLTTRRRTCPICKGDVVRSLARGSSSSPRYEPYQDDSDDETIAEASGSRGHDFDLERGILSPEPQEPHRSSRQDRWLNHLWPSTFGYRSHTRSPPPDDRDR